MVLSWVAARADEAVGARIPMHPGPAVQQKLPTGGKGGHARRTKGNEMADHRVSDEKTKKCCILVHFGASLVQAYLALHNRWCLPTAWKAVLRERMRNSLHFVASIYIWREERKKISKSDAKRCILMHGERATLEIRRISGVSNSNDASSVDQKIVRLMHCVA